MSNLTIRRLDEGLKRRLRLLAAEHGRSMEDEVRRILADRLGAGSTPVEPAPSPHAIAGGASRSTPDLAPSSSPTLANTRVLLVIGGGIAAYKSLDLIRRLKERGARVRVVMTRAAQEFVTALAAGALAGERTFVDLFDPADEFDIGHIRLARETDLVVVAPATADLMAKMAGGHADDLATAVLLATDKPILAAPAMNPQMWRNAATQRNAAQLLRDGVRLVGPNHGEMAERGEAGLGRMAEPLEIAAAAACLLEKMSGPRPLRGKRVVITSGPTHEPIDPVRYIANRSSGKQGHAVAQAAAAVGAEVVLVSGPVGLPDPPGVTVVRVESARDMLAAVEAALPADVGVFAAAVADWRVADAGDQKLKKEGGATPRLALVENPDILASVAQRASGRPALVIGFAAETEHVVRHAQAKLKRKGCDWILANDVSPASGVMGGDENSIHLVTAAGVEAWPKQSKAEVARMLVQKIADTLADAGAARETA